MVTQISQHFTAEEFACNHCGKSHPDGVPQELLTILEAVREHYGTPVNINSGYRCPTHNKNVGGAINSYHMKGLAADFWMKNVDPHTVYRDLNQNHEGGLGDYNTFTHVDVRGYRARW